MAFVNDLELDYHKLPLETRYRFAEIELKHGIDCLTQLFIHTDTPRLKAVKMMYEAITISHMQSDERESAFMDAVNSRLFNQIRKEEIIQMFRYRGASYQKIRDLTGSSPNTIAKLKYDIPEYFPIYRFWDTPTLYHWNESKKGMNLFREELIYHDFQ